MRGSWREMCYLAVNTPLIWMDQWAWSSMPLNNWKQGCCIPLLYQLPIPQGWHMRSVHYSKHPCILPWSLPTMVLWLILQLSHYIYNVYLWFVAKLWFIHLDNPTRPSENEGCLEECNWANVSKPLIHLTWRDIGNIGLKCSCTHWVLPSQPNYQHKPRSKCWP